MHSFKIYNNVYLKNNFDVYNLTQNIPIHYPFVIYLPIFVPFCVLLQPFLQSFYNYFAKYSDKLKYNS